MESEYSNFWTESYRRHICHDSEFSNEGKAESWKRFDTIDAWRHKRMYENLLPLINTYPDSSWITIGDGRFGTDANFLLRNGIKNVVATNITDYNLKQAHEDGFINEFSSQNAEMLTYPDESFDFVLCKETYHHLPRPILALYEMIRVARFGVVLIEPNDVNIEVTSANSSIAHRKRNKVITKEFIMQMLRIPIHRSYGMPEYEETGNYIYSISEREIEKVALGLNLPFVAFKGLNDFYQDGVEFEKADCNSTLFLKIKKEISKMDKLCMSGISRHKIIVAAILKKSPDKQLFNSLMDNHFVLRPLPMNPYVS